MVRSTAATWLQRIFLFGLIVAFAVVVGSFAGSWYNHRRAYADAISYNATVDEYLHSNLRGISVGQPFPDVPLTQLGVVEPQHVRDFMPRGGVVLFLSSECGTCVQTVESLVGIVGADRLAERFLLIVDSDAAPMHEYLGAHGADVHLVQDMRRELQYTYGVTAFPAYFVLDPQLQVVNLGTASGVIDDLVQLARE